MIENRPRSSTFEEVLLGVRNGASAEIGQADDAAVDDIRAVWHATEIALGILREDYVPKEEALHDARALLERVGYEELASA